jgi:uncharacterized protein (DUF885 family)
MMKQIFFVILLLLVCVNHAVSQQTTYPDSAKVEKLFDDYFREFIQLNPDEASQLGLPKEWGYDYDRGGFDNVSDVGIKANFDLYRKYLDEIKNIDTTRITKSQNIDLNILRLYLETQLEGEKFAYHRYFIDHLTGAHSQVTNVLTEYHTISDLQDANDYLARLENIPLRLEQTQKQIEVQEKKRIRPSIYIVDRVIGSMEEFVQPDPKSNLLYLDLDRKLSPLSSIDPDTSGELRRRAETTLKEKVYPAYDKFIKNLKTLIPNADSIPGVWKLPDGDQYYQYCLKSQSTSSLTPEQVYQLGQREVKLLQDQAKILLDSLGIKGNKTYGELMNDYWAMQNRPENTDRFNYPDVPEQRQMILHDYQVYIDSAQLRLPEAFKYITKTRVVVQAVPEYKEQGGLTYYEPASLDGMRKGVFYVNLLNAPGKAGMRNLVYHETIPGHHYQIALQQELTQKRLFKNLLYFNGFVEGWAMYAEALAGEIGWLPDIYSRLSELNSQLFRAVRIVVDSGIHYKKWSKEQALQYMLDNLGWNSDNEIDRYTVWPGQATCYTLGKLKIMELREKAKKELGPKFDLKDFHMVVLENGSLPLDLLEEIVGDYISSNR